MELISREMPKDYTMVDTSDWHLGALNCHKDAIEEMLGKIARKKNYYMMSKGDLIEAILPSDKRYACCSVDVKEGLLTPAQQADKIVSMCQPIKKKIVAFGLGNHEYHLLNTQDFGRYIAAQLGVPYGTAAYKFIATDKIGNVYHKFFATHGRRQLPKGAKDPIQREANRKAALRRMLEETGWGDCIYMSCGHTHQLLVVEPTTTSSLYLTDSGGSIHQHFRVQGAQNRDYIPPDSRWYSNSGSFLKLYSPPGSQAIGYGEMAMFGPAEIGWIEIHVQGGQVVQVEKVTT